MKKWRPILLNPYLYGDFVAVEELASPETFVIQEYHLITTTLFFNIINI